MSETDDEQALMAELQRIIDGAAVGQGMVIKSPGFTINVTPEQADLLRRLAHQRGVTVTALVRQWMLDQFDRHKFDDMTEDELRSAIARLRRKAEEP